MSSSATNIPPYRFHSPKWDSKSKRPIVNQRYNDPQTGELHTATGPVYSGPPAVDIIVLNTHPKSQHCCVRAQQPFPAEKILKLIVKLVSKHGLELDSLNMTKYAICVIIAQEMSKEEFNKVAKDMAFGIWYADMI